MPGWAVTLRLTGLGWYVVVCLAGGTAGGRALDGWLDISPALTLSGLVLGIVVASFGVYRMLAPILNSTRTIKRAKEEGREK